MKGFGACRRYARCDSHIAHYPAISPIMSTTPDPLDPMFARWQADTPALPRSVRSEVWNRIEHEEAHPGFAGWFARIETAFCRPAFAMAFVAICVLLGLFLAETRLTATHAERAAELEQKYLSLQYLSLLDPQVETSAAPVIPASLSR